MGTTYSLVCPHLMSSAQDTHIAHVSILQHNQRHTCSLDMLDLFQDIARVKLAQFDAKDLCLSFDAKLVSYKAEFKSVSLKNENMEFATKL